MKSRLPKRETVHIEGDLDQGTHNVATEPSARSRTGKPGRPHAPDRPRVLLHTCRYTIGVDFPFPLFASFRRSHSEGYRERQVHILTDAEPASLAAGDEVTTVIALYAALECLAYEIMPPAKAIFQIESAHTAHSLSFSSIFNTDEITPTVLDGLPS